jgi:glutamate racemase
LTVVREIRRLLPSESIVYFGDIARLPYGIKSKEQILNYSIQNTLFLMKHKVKAVVVACNSSASAAYAFLKRSFSLPVVDVIEPAAQMAVQMTRSGRIGVIATRSTVSSGAYERALKKRNPKALVFQAACPLFVSLVEEGWVQGKITDQIVEAYLAPVKAKRPDTLILGCTHYPLLYGAIQKNVGARVQLIDSAAPTVRKLAAILNQNGLTHAGSQRGELRIYVSDMPGNFVPVGETFLGEKLDRVEVVRHKG